ncbi:quinone oxidoreductase family protein [Bradyrhizobium sp. HKCCYLS1011]|uniref:quinone oxidoreductase family protein n=1 Tax=Bradyrhizobium sp. HKCCYLS1011 TaxID=3420733 RepID=UPI003EBBFEF3
MIMPDVPTTMKAWRLDRLGGRLSYDEGPVPDVRPGSVLVKVEASALMTYMKAYIEGGLPSYHAPDGCFTPGGNCVGIVGKVGKDVWHLRPGQRVLLSSLFQATENVPDPARILIGVTSFGGVSETMQADWPNGTLAEYALLPASAVVPADGWDDVAPMRLAAATRFVVPYGGFVRGRLAAGETVIVNGATGAYGSAAVLLALAMGAGRVVAAGRNADKLAALAERGGRAVVPIALSGDIKADAEALRTAAEGSADLAFDMIGGAQDPNSTLAALHALRSEGRLVLMGSLMVDLPVPYLQVMIRSIKLIGNFMHRPGALRNVLALARAGHLDLSAIKPKPFPLADLLPAMEAAATAGSFEQIVMCP